MDDERELREAVENWKTSKSHEEYNRENLSAVLRSKINKYKLTELSDVTGIKRTTLYYMIWGKSGKRRQTSG